MVVVADEKDRGKENDVKNESTCVTVVTNVIERNVNVTRNEFSFLERVEKCNAFTIMRNFL